MQTIQIEITARRAKVLGSPVLVCNNTGDQIAFTFDDEWADATEKTARFVYNKDGKAVHQDVIFTGDTVEVPQLSNTRDVRVGVYAGDLTTTTAARIPCEPSILCGSGEHEEPAPDIYNQLMAKLNEMEGGGLNVITSEADITELDKGFYLIDGANGGSVYAGPLTEVPSYVGSGSFFDGFLLISDYGGDATTKLATIIATADGDYVPRTFVVVYDEAGSLLAEMGHELVTRKTLDEEIAALQAQLDALK